MFRQHIATNNQPLTWIASTEQKNAKSK